LIEDVVEEKQLILFVHQQAHTWVYLMTPTWVVNIILNQN
jgi:hypothetical protein